VRKFSPPDLLAEQNRGLLLDVFVFVLNLVLMRWLTRYFISLFQLSAADVPLAQYTLLLVCLSMWVLPAAGAVLKRWHFHERLQREGKNIEEEWQLAGCVFNPVFYFSLNIVIICVLIAGVDTLFFGDRLRDNGDVFVPVILGAMVCTIAQTYLIYRYFNAPKKPPRFEFLRRPESEILGDVFIFVNMILFQVGWNILTSARLDRPSDPAEFVGRLMFLCFIAMLVYFPPRIFYLAEDIGRGRTWLMMLLANSPVIVRLLVGK
jgi:hypothetical protein